MNLKEPLAETLRMYLFRYPREDPAEFNERLKRLAQVNFVNGIIEFYLAMLFSTSIQIDSVKYQDEVNEFVNSCTTSGDSLRDYFREMVAPSALLFGSTDVFVDLPSTDREILTLAEQQAAGLNNPYCYIVPPLNRTAWELDAARQYTYYQSVDVINTQVTAQMGLNDSKQFRQWTTEQVILMDAEGSNQPKVIENKANPYGFIPAVTVIPIPSMRFFNERLGLSLVQDVIPLQKLVLNLISLMMDFHESVNFAQRVIIQDTSNGDDPPAEDEVKEAGNKRGMVLYGAQSKFEIVTPQTGGVEAMRNFLQDTIDNIYQSVVMESSSEWNKTHQSTNTVRANNQRLYSRLAKISKHFEKAMKAIIEMSLRVRGIKDWQTAGVTVQWSDNFSNEAFISALEELKALRQAAGDLSNTAVKEFSKKVVAPKLYSTGKLETINSEIDAFKGPTGLDDSVPDDTRKDNSAIKAAGQVAQSE